MPKPTKTALLTGLLALLPLVSNAQTCKSESIPATTPTSQLTDNNDGTVTDTKTGLMWKQCSEGLSGLGCTTDMAQGYTWEEALAQAQMVNASGGFAGYADWRLPNLKELRSITEKQCYSPAINLVRFPSPNTNQYEIRYADFWSASAAAEYGDAAWVVGFINGGDERYLKSTTFQVRLVRDTQSIKGSGSID